VAREKQSAAPRRVTCDVTGIVQGVGFRPTIYRLARAAGLGGSVQNRSGSVRLVLEGSLERIRAFLAVLPASIPPNARLDSITEIENVVRTGAPLPFRIDASSGDEAAQVLIPADLAICPDCLREILDPADRRHGYPFTTCTRCGPRYTVINGMPYDRIRTTMSVFSLCPACRREYDDPADRRFHAESIACPTCGPHLRLEDAQGNAVAGDPLRQARAALAAGAVVAVRGLGGFLLAADATNRRTLEELRRRKHRPHKPFAIMARALALVEGTCFLDVASARLLQSAVAPIVVLDVRPDEERRRRAALQREDQPPGRAELEGAAPSAPCLALDLLSPDTQTLGVMLSTTPLHVLLATPLPGDPTRALDWLVMTSGNRGGEPICISNDEARERLRGIADFFLLHDREINLRCDDSICVSPVLMAKDFSRTGGASSASPSWRRGAPPSNVTAGNDEESTYQVWRRARGFAPNPILLSCPLRCAVLAMGAEMKNAIAIGYGDRVIASPHIGDLEAPEAVDGLRQVAEALPRFVNRVPEIVAVDAHPDMLSSRVGREIAKRLGVPAREVQHHHAHAAACLGEHGLQEGLALVFDGTGLGPDGHIWGAELLDVQSGAFQRLASFAGVPLPGGDAAVQRPARQLAGRCVAAGIDLPVERRVELGIGDEEWQVWRQQCAAGVHAPVTHAAGRLFDSFAVALGLANRTTTYEGQTAIRLEAAARRFPAGGHFPVVPYRATRDNDMLWIDWSDAFRMLLGEKGVAAAVSAAESTACGTHAATQSAWAYAAHVAIAAAAAEMIRYGTEATEQRAVALSGGVFLNRILTGLLVSQLEEMGLTVLLHRATPPNDGCIAIGQAIVAGGSENVMQYLECGKPGRCE
jgi:hydrogenase maturation protein HypF